MNLSGYVARSSLSIGSRFVGSSALSQFHLHGEFNFCGSMDAYQSQLVDGKQYISLITEKEVDESLIDKEKASDETTVIPATVLQYERQMRKRRAAHKAQGPVTREEHLKVVYQDEHLVVTNKPSGILCVPGIHHNPSLLTIVFDAYRPKKESSPLSPPQMIIHRLDMDTSGIVVFGRTQQAVTGLQKAFRERTTLKRYQALVCGHVNVDEGVIDLPLQRDHERPPFMRVSTPSSEQAAAQAVHDLQHHGYKKLIRKRPKQSSTEWSVISREYLNDNNNSDLPVTRLALTPITGRTHQLRVHCAALGHPIVGDPAYGIYGEASANGGFSESILAQIAPHRASLVLQKEINKAHGSNSMCLHAHQLHVNHPISGEKMMWEAAPVPF